MRHSTVILWCVLQCCALGSLPAQTPAPLALQLLKDYWPRSVENAEQSQKAFAAAPAAAQQDVATRSAFALNRIQHSRYREALPVARQVVEQMPQDPDAWMTVSWLEVLLQSNDEGLISLQKLRQAIEPLAADSARRNFFVRHMGRLIGYVEGPTGGSGNPEILASTMDIVREGLSPNELKLFQEMREGVLAEYVRLGGKREAAKTDFLADAKTKADAETQTLESQNQLLMQRRESIPQQLSQLADSYNSQASSLRAQAQPLQSDLAFLQQQHNSLQVELQQHYAQIAYYQSLLNQNQNANDRFWLNSQLNQFLIFSRNVESQILNIQGQIRSIDSQLGSLNRQLEQVTAQYNLQSNRLQGEQNELDRQLGRNMNRVQKLAEGPKRITGEALSITNRIDKLKTYYDLPAEQLRNDLLTRIQAPAQPPQ